MDRFFDRCHYRSARLLRRVADLQQLVRDYEALIAKSSATAIERLRPRQAAAEQQLAIIWQQGEKLY